MQPFFAILTILIILQIASADFLDSPINGFSNSTQKSFLSPIVLKKFDDSFDTTHELFLERMNWNDYLDLNQSIDCSSIKIPAIESFTIFIKPVKSREIKIYPIICNDNESKILGITLITHSQYLTIDTNFSLQNEIKEIYIKNRENYKMISNHKRYKRTSNFYQELYDLYIQSKCFTCAVVEFTKFDQFSLSGKN